MNHDDKNKQEQIAVRIGKRFELQVIEVSEEEGRSVHTVVPVKVWILTFLTLSVSLLALVLQLASMLSG